jgi:hypothetical protein
MNQQNPKCLKMSFPVTYLKSVLVSLGTGPSKSNRSGMNSSALSQT